MRDRARAESAGRRAETVAAWWLRLHGWRIVARRARVPGGEVDIVARRLSTLAFVEVKARANSADLDHAIDRHRLRRVAVAAERLAPRFERAGDTIRLDVMLIAPRRWPRHIVNVWHG